MALKAVDEFFSKLCLKDNNNNQGLTQVFNFCSSLEHFHAIRKADLG